MGICECVGPVAIICGFSVVQENGTSNLYIVQGSVRHHVTEQKKKAEVQLPASTKAKLKRQVLMQKERSLIYMLCHLGEWGTPRLLAHLFLVTHPQQDQNKEQCPQFLLYFKVSSFGACRWLLSDHPGSLACSQLLLGFRLPPGGCV